ncbi:hypothetical protein [Pseudoalteromonas sp. UBA2102]|uniref:hypothetical protein n=1 Tax=Pseudoalteromonas sp. UBA2102 TaxID=1947291 RepID=UPI00257FE4F6|nr:hypothetical protein [Pseudoalteromonas sp. UBA2102]|tara:strand:- start:1110 stop:2018 length:909 start_codon:yes stop_codon:yes gene_type:complete
MNNSIFPASNDAFKLFTKNLNDKLIKGSNGQYRRKHTFLSAMIAESLPGKDVNYNINTLKADLKHNNTNSIKNTSVFTSYNSNTLYKIVKEGKRLRKETDMALWDAYCKVAGDYQLSNPNEIATACKIPVKNNEFHRVIIGNIIIALYVGRGSKHNSDRDINIVAYDMPDNCKYSSSGLFTGSVSYGDMLTIGYPTSFGNRKTDLNVYHICKYSQSEARIPLSNLTRDQVLLLAAHLCIKVDEQKFESYKDIPFNNIVSSQLFYHLQEWSLRHTAIVKNSTSPYFENWGNLALNRPMNVFHP